LAATSSMGLTGGPGWGSILALDPVLQTVMTIDK